MTTKKKGPRARCKRCGAAIRIPPGWSVGAASRRHYWRKHREVMLGKRSSETKWTRK